MLYWSSKGHHQAKLDILDKQIPGQGECPKSRPKLELLRRANNAYYDIFNNGGGNRDDDIEALFSIEMNSHRWQKKDSDDLDFQLIGERADSHMDTYILDAWAEYEALAELTPKDAQVEKLAAEMMLMAQEVALSNPHLSNLLRSFGADRILCRRFGELLMRHPDKTSALRELTQ